MLTKVSIGHEFARTRLNRCRDQIISMHDLVNALHAVVNIHEAARLFAVTPDRDLEVVLVDRLDHLAGNRCP